jgi:enoyl-CoA hydratase
VANHDAAVLLERRGAVLEMTLNRPDRLNAIDAPLHEQLHRTFLEIATMPDVRAVVFAAKGKAFSAGGDFEFILDQNLHVDQETAVTEGLAILSSFLDIPAPVVVAMQGDAMGIGASLALAGDAIVTHPTVRIADPHVIVGLAAGDGGCLVWPQSAGMVLAKRHLLTAEPMSGETAARAGLVSDLVVLPTDVLPCARAIADRIARLPPLAVQGTKRALNRLVRSRFDEVMELSARIEMESLVSADVREAIAAIREHRTGVFTGH